TVLLFAGFRWYRSRHFGRVIVALVGAVLLHFTSASLVGPSMRGYLYEVSDSKKTFLEVPFKGLRYERMIEVYRSESDGQLFGTFEKDWWNFYRWRDYATHPRWKFPYRPRSDGQTTPQ